jgi:dihydropyrimidinase
MPPNKTPFIPEYLKKRRTTFVPEWISRDKPSPLAEKKVPAALRESPAYNGIPENTPVILKGGKCIIPNKGILPLDIRIQDGKIHSLGQNLSDNDAVTVEVDGKYVIPGVIDPHVHLGIFTAFDTEIVTETRSALVNGVTTIGFYLISQDSYLNTLDEIIDKIESRSFCDVFIHLAILNQKQLEEIPLYYSRYGITSYKTWMCGIPGLISDVEDDFLLDLMEKIASLGNDAVLNIHAENHRIVDRATKRLKKAKPAPDSLKTWEESHPGLAEAEAVQRASFLAKETGIRIYFVHISSKETIKIAKELKRENKDIYFETTSPYLTMSLEQDIDFLYKMSPPIRKEDDQRSLWEGLAEDLLDTIGTDHTCMSTDEKKTTSNLWDIPPGYPAVGTHLPSLLDRARSNNFPLTELIEKITASPAKIFGLYPKKGTILPGSDADLVIIDPTVEKDVTPEITASRSDYCLHQGRKLIGWPVAVVKSGKIITRENFEQVKGSIKGRYLKRG